jgi:hypothetical protein
MNAATMRERAHAIRMPKGLIAQRCGMHRDGVWSVMHGIKDARRSSVDRITAAILAEERALLAHLLALHPDMRTPPNFPEP